MAIFVILAVFAQCGGNPEPRVMNFFAMKKNRKFFHHPFPAENNIRRFYGVDGAQRDVVRIAVAHAHQVKLGRLVHCSVGIAMEKRVCPPMVNIAVNSSNLAKLDFLIMVCLLMCVHLTFASFPGIVFSSAPIARSGDPLRPLLLTAQLRRIRHNIQKRLWTETIMPMSSIDLSTIFKNGFEQPVFFSYLSVGHCLKHHLVIDQAHAYYPALYHFLIAKYADKPPGIFSFRFYDINGFHNHLFMAAPYQICICLTHLVSPPLKYLPLLLHNAAKVPFECQQFRLLPGIMGETISLPDSM